MHMLKGPFHIAVLHRSVGEAECMACSGSIVVVVCATSVIEVVVCVCYGIVGALMFAVFCVADKELVACGTALRDFVSIVDTVGGRREQGRAR